MAQTAAQKRWAREIYEAAQQSTDISPLFVAAQAALETGWGKSKVGQYNLFGITKGSNWTGKTVLVQTHEYFNTPSKKFTPPEKVISVVRTKNGRYYYTVKRLFKDFDSLADCLKEYVRLYQKPGYADAWPYRKDPYEFARRICDGVGCKYATAPTYPALIRSLIKTMEKICLER
ncbi:MAG: glucosaminidase domain-containing protein [Bacteroidaceae bacterium]|nr:glucosaminidase domain-containing protein [Bacteroidaceae bacterium]